MPISLGSAYLTLRVKGDEFKAGLGKAKTQAATTTKGIGQSFTNLQGKIQGAAGKVPVVGSSLAALASPAGLAAAGIGLVVGGLTKMVTKTLDVGRSLGEMREATGVSAENLQIYQRAIEETNGDAGKFDDVILRLSKSSATRIPATRLRRTVSTPWGCPGRTWRTNPQTMR